MYYHYTKAATNKKFLTYTTENCVCDVREVLLLQDTVVESRELRSNFDKLRLERIEKNELWWLLSRANQFHVGQEFLKDPFVVDRALEWFQQQVRSGTLHTLQVPRTNLTCVLIV